MSSFDDIDASPRRPTSGATRSLRAHRALNGYVLSLAALHEDAQVGLAALQSEARRWGQSHGLPARDPAQTPACYWSYLQPPEAVQRECRFLLHEGRFRLGRSPDADLHFDCPGVSRRHAEIVVLPTRGALVRDLGSVNGTRIDGELITEAAIDGWVVLDIGPLRLNLGPDGLA
ncbi:MAG: FHA domain-containing protein [Xanthomonadales bacterium]|nr:FHA domain-containing protein [Xanthomonadales bacterium]MBK7145474.1 FHA domain-containing protein [Xanthomonadales bacterium]MCC6559796.1 FHA domain-containing protein [Xanthomonadales bacterium]